MNHGLLPTVYEVVLARPATTGWVGRALAPAVRACRFRDPPPPLEFNSLHPHIGGLVSPIGPADGRVQISRHAITFWSPSGLLKTYLHEVAHRLCMQASGGDPDHGPIFFAVLCTLAARADSAEDNSPLTTQVHRLGRYDWRDRPCEFEGMPDADWEAEVLRFGIACSLVVADLEIAAEDLPHEISRRWVDFTQDALRRHHAVEAVRVQRHALIESQASAAAWAKRAVELEKQLLKSTIPVVAIVSALGVGAALGGWLVAVFTLFK